MEAGTCQGLSPVPSGLLGKLCLAFFPLHLVAIGCHKGRRNRALAVDCSLMMFFTCAPGPGGHCSGS